MPQVAQVHIELRRAPRIAGGDCLGAGLDQVEVRMSLEQLSGNRIGMGFDYLRLAAAGPELLARGRQTVACMRRNPSGLEPEPVPEELRLALSRYAAS